MKKTMKHILKFFKPRDIITPEDLIAIGIPKGTAYAFLPKHSVHNGSTTVYFERVGRGKYKVLPL